MRQDTQLYPTCWKPRYWVSRKNTKWRDYTHDSSHNNHNHYNCYDTYFECGENFWYCVLLLLLTTSVNFAQSKDTGLFKLKMEGIVPCNLFQVSALVNEVDLWSLGLRNEGYCIDAEVPSASHSWEGCSNFRRCATVVHNQVLETTSIISPTPGCEQPWHTF